MKELPNVGLFGTGEKEYGKGGSGIEKILEAFGLLEIKDTVKVIVSNNWNGGVKQKAYENGIPFKAMTKLPNSESDGTYSELAKEQMANRYLGIVQDYNLDYVFLSGWFVYVIGLEPNKTVNIHPGPTHEPYGGKGMYGIKVHEKIFQDYIDGKINQTCITMHYVTDKYDDGPIIAQVPVSISGCKNVKELQNRVNEIEKIFQWKITLMVMTGEIFWSGIKGEPVVFPNDFIWGKEIDLTEGIPYDKKT
ncbi:MAG: formyltransferase family protein [Candidatus Gracilibacteria bacterium]|nr:formyltransferase family protein [Candidatus Gracilibacteria bacterium]